MGAASSTHAAAQVVHHIEPRGSASSPSGGCPVQHDKLTVPQGAPSAGISYKPIPSECPMHQKNDSTTAPSYGYISECPASAGQKIGDQPGDLDPRNMMPPPNQRPAPDQPFSLPTNRVVSSIPKAGADGDNWVYPSEQMFWNAMLRKGWRWKEADISQKDMKDIINIHNANNEQAWLEVLKWEALRAKEGHQPQLKSFRGKAKEFSPRARIRGWLGYELPFDRHDWIVQRGDKEVRYIIDYYDGGDVDKRTFEFSLLDVRPAMDSFEACWDRMKVAWWRWTVGNKQNTASASQEVSMGSDVNKSDSS